MFIAQELKVFMPQSVKHFCKTFVKQRTISELNKTYFCKDTFFLDSGQRNGTCFAISHDVLQIDVTYWMIYQRRFCREIQVGRFFFVMDRDTIIVSDSLQ